jgi:hypothetical protein
MMNQLRVIEKNGSDDNREKNRPEDSGSVFTH